MSNKHPKQTTTAIQKATWSGPLPPPAALEGFERIHPGSAKLIIDHMIAEGEHRRKIEQQAIDLDRLTLTGEHSIVRRGQWFGVIISILVLGGGIGLAYAGRDVSGLGTVITGGAALLASMWFGRNQTKKTGE